jgi:hypothetical protein
MDHRDVEEIAARCSRAANRLAKWRTVFAGWQLGTRPNSDGESKAVRDHREVTMLMRAELSALTKVLLDKGVCTQVEITEAFTEEYEHLDRAYREKFPGFEATDTGVTITPEPASQTMRDLGFPP